MDPTTETVSTPAPEPTAPPQVDMADVKSAATEAAKSAVGDLDKLVQEAASKKVQEAFRKLSGAEDEPTIDPVLQELIKNPAQALVTVKQMAVDEAKASIRADANKAAADERESKAIVDPFLAEYPGIRDHLDIVDGLIRNKIDQGTEFKEAVKTAFEQTVKHLGLPNAREVAQQRRVQAAGLPPVSGGYGGGGGKAEFNEADSTAGYVQRLRDHAKAMRSRKS